MTSFDAPAHGDLGDEARAHAAEEDRLAPGELVGRAAPFGLFERSIAGRYLLAKRAHGGVALISIISFVGILLAVAVLIVVMSVMNGFRHDLLEKLLGAQGHIFVYSDFEDPGRARDMAERISAIPGIVRAAPVIAGNAGIITGDSFSGVQIYGLARQDLKSLTLVREGVTAGGIEDFGAGDRGGDTILIGRALAARLGIWVGDPVRLYSPSTGATVMGATPRSKTYYVGGIFSVGMSQIDDLFVYMPIDQARIFLGHSPAHAADFIEVSVDDPDTVDSARRALEQELGDTANLRDWRDNYASYDSALRTERNVMRLILGMLVLIAALNIISGLVMLAKNKAGDVAILRTIGASRGSIMRIFFMIGAAIGFLGTIAGLVIGVLFCKNIGAIQHALEWLLNTKLFPDDIYFLAQIPARPEWGEITIVALMSFGMSCLATLLPAWNAARLDPVETLRYE